MAEEPYERLSSQDSSFLTFERRTTHMHVGAVAIFEAGPLATADGGIDFQRLEEFVESRLHRIPRYRKKIHFTPIQGHPVWVDDDRFNLRYHVRCTSLPRPGTEQALKNLVGRILSQHLDREKPLWEMWIVEGLAEGRFALISKVHHCMVDGVSGMNLLSLLFSPRADETTEPGPKWQPGPQPSRLRLLLDEASHGFRTPLGALRGVAASLADPRAAWETIVDAGTAVSQALEAGLRIPAPTPLNRAIGPHRRVEWGNLDLALVKEVKNRLGGTVNDVVLTVVAGALHRFLRADEAWEPTLDYRVVVPVNMRQQGDETSQANRVSALFLSLPVAEADPGRRFERIRAETGRLKESRAAEGIDLFTRLADHTGASWFTRVGVRLAARMRPHHLIVTNVPGPQSPLYVLGARLLEIYPQLPLFEEQGLGVAVLSYCDKVGWGLVGDWELLPRLADLGEAIGASFAELYEAARAPRPVEPRSPSRKRRSSAKGSRGRRSISTGTPRGTWSGPARKTR